MTRFVAEISSNHNGDLDRCLSLVDTAAQINCDAVKLQLFRIDRLFAPEILEVREDLRRRADWELPLDWIPILGARCREKGLQFGCTPFYLEALEALIHQVDFLKVASYELLWQPLLAGCARTGKPLVLSTGMASLQEIERAVATIREAGGSELTLLHCISGYPTPVKQCNLKALETLRHRFDCPVGWSDHSVSAAVISRAVHRWGADLVEFHLDLDGTGQEYPGGHCWLPQAISEVIKEVRLAEAADGTGIKEPAEAETADRGWRADPGDGLRPLLSTRIELRKTECTR